MLLTRKELDEEETSLLYPNTKFEQAGGLERMYKRVKVVREVKNPLAM